MKRLIKIILITLLTLLLIAVIVTALTYFKIIHLPWLEESALYQLLPGAKTVQVVEQDETQTVEEDGTETLPDETQIALQAMQKENEDLKEQIVIKDTVISEWNDKEQGWQSTEADLRQQIELLNQEILSIQDSKQKDYQNEVKQAYKDLANYYINMNAQKAADIAANLTNDELIGVLGQMDKETAAAIVERLPKEKAASISRQMLIVSP